MQKKKTVINKKAVKNYLFNNIKLSFKNHKKFFIGIGMFLLLSFALYPFAIKYLNIKPLDIFVSEEGSCETDFYVAPVCNSIAFKASDGVKKLIVNTKEEAPSFQPNEEVKLDISSTNSEYKIISIGYDKTNYFQRITNPSKGDKIELPKEPGYYYVATNMYGTSACKILCTGTVYEGKDKFKCLDSGNFVNTGRSCINNCSGWIKIGNPTQDTPASSQAQACIDGCAKCDSAGNMIGLDFGSESSFTDTAGRSWGDHWTYCNNTYGNTDSTPSTSTSCVNGQGIDCDGDGSTCTVNGSLNFKDAGSEGTSGWCTCCKQYLNNSSFANINGAVSRCINSCNNLNCTNLNNQSSCNATTYCQWDGTCKVKTTSTNDSSSEAQACIDGCASCDSAGNIIGLDFGSESNFTDTAGRSWNDHWTYCNSTYGN